ncbi:MAG: hypothetical protein IJ545_04830 [Alphaproteobacteria bacterium]|nr:hypothetical protein [Alphaproteobacteria bacterium]
MSDSLLIKYKNLTPTPKRSGTISLTTRQVSADYLDRMHDQFDRLRLFKRKQKIKMAVLCVCGIAAAGFVGYEKVQYNKSFDNCVQTLNQVKANAQILNKNITALRREMQGFEVVDYE